MSGKFDLTYGAKAVDSIMEICKRRGRAVILMQNNPDPDAIASALALRELIHLGAQKRAVIGYGGICGRVENRTMMNVLRVGAKKIEPADLIYFRTVCLVDTQPGFTNNALLDAIPADVVIDHHLTPRRAWTAAFADIRENYGATSTILYEYFAATGARLPQNAATALFYGIESDTQDLGREASPADIAAFQALVSQADMRKLAQIRRAQAPPSYFRMIHDALGRCVIAGPAVICEALAARSPDDLAEIADYLMRVRGARATVCYGLIGNTIYLSARAMDARGAAAERLRRVVRGIGTGGGHRTMAGAQVTAGSNPAERLGLVRERILRVFARGHDPKPLLGAGVISR